jgi:hypothetical protein
MGLRLSINSLGSCAEKCFNRTLNLKLREYQELKAEIQMLSEEVKCEEIIANKLLEVDK